MDPTRFDTLTKRLVAPTTRRSALGAAVTGGLLSALGLARAVPEARAAQGGTCVLAFAAQVRQGPSVQQPLTAGSARGGEVRGELSFSLMPSGTLQNATLTLDDGSQLPVVGQANGYALQVRIELEPRVALVAIGVGEQEIARCQGAVDGVAAGPQVGDLGDWHAAGVQQARGSGGSGSGAQAGSGTTARGSSAGTGRGNAGSGNAGSGNAGGQTSPQAQGTGSSAANRDGSCAVGLVRCVCPDPPVDDAVCEGGCTDLNRDNTNCGACNTRCRRDLNEVCLDGVCVVLDDGVDDSCGGGFTLCAGVCVDTLTNGDHCGACNARCNIAAGESCFNGVCGILDVGVLCAVGLFDCAGTCVSFSDETNCGGCGIVCEEGTSCAGGVCCLFGLTLCDGVCVDFQTDPFNCGNCDVVCEEGTTCQSGVCSTPGGGGCLVGLTDCGGVCVDLASDPFNCSGCGAACLDGTTCQGGACIASAPPPAGVICTAGLSDCGGVCVDVATNPNHCGECGYQCATGTTCQGGACITDAPV